MSDLKEDTKDNRNYRVGSFKKGKKNNKYNFDTDIEGEESDPEDFREK